MTEKPFLHKSAFVNLKTNFMFHQEVVEILPKIIRKKGILNVGGKSQSAYSFAIKTNPKVKKAYVGKKIKMSLNQTMNLSKLNKLLRKK